MRFKLNLNIERQKDGNLLPINMQYYQSAAIYKILSSASEKYSTWLHENGFVESDGKLKSFKLFTFSRFFNFNFKLLKSTERIAIMSDSVDWIISFLPEKSTETFIQGLFSNQVLCIGDRLSRVSFNVSGVELLATPNFTDEMTFVTLSPICLKERRNDGSTYYLSPKDEKYESSLLYSLLSKYYAYYKKDFNSCKELRIELLTEPKPVLTKIKAGTSNETRVRGYMYKFKIKAPHQLIELMYEGGMGEQCSQGFGCIEVSK